MLSNDPDDAGDVAAGRQTSPLVPTWPDWSEAPDDDGQPHGAAVTGPDYTTWFSHSVAPTERAEPVELPVTRVVQPAPGPRRTRRGLVALIGLMVTATAVASAIVVWPRDAAHAPPPAAAAGSSAAVEVTTQSSPTVTDAWCESHVSAERVSGNGEGSIASAQDVILALEYAYYTYRDATAVRALLAPEGRFGTNAEIQAGIDAVPTDTAHCVEISPVDVDRWAVTITERWPDDSTVVHHQLISTVTRDARSFVLAVESA